MSPALTNFLFEAVNFLLLAAVLGWLLFKPVRRALDAERARHDREVEESKRLRAEAESLANDARAAKTAAGHEADERRRETLEAARQEAAEIVEAARKAQLDERRRFEQELSSRREAEASALADVVGRIAAESVRSLLHTVEGPELDAALVRAARAELDAVPREARKAAVVESARPLDAKSRSLLQAALGDGFRERVVPELGAGVRVTTPAGQIDATATSLARQAASTLKRAAAADEMGVVDD
jgi:F0F1-type ATP synthase membrane subunit b/b'